MGPDPAILLNVEWVDACNACKHAHFSPPCRVPNQLEVVAVRERCDAVDHRSQRACERRGGPCQAETPQSAVHQPHDKQRASIALQPKYSIRIWSCNTHHMPAARLSTLRTHAMWQQLGKTVAPHISLRHPQNRCISEKCSLARPPIQADNSITCASACREQKGLTLRTQAKVQNRNLRLPRVINVYQGLPSTRAEQCGVVAFLPPGLRCGGAQARHRMLLMSVLMRLQTVKDGALAPRASCSMMTATVPHWVPTSSSLCGAWGLHFAHVGLSFDNLDAGTSILGLRVTRYRSSTVHGNTWLILQMSMQDR